MTRQCKRFPVECRGEACKGLHTGIMVCGQDKHHLCPTCKRARKSQKRNECYHRAHPGAKTLTPTLALTPMELEVKDGRSLQSLNRTDGEIGGPYSFASLGELYHWTQLDGKALNMDVMRRPVGQRAGQLLRPTKRSHNA